MFGFVCFDQCRIHTAGQQKTPISVTKDEFLEYIEEQLKTSNRGIYGRCYVIYTNSHNLLLSLFTLQPTNNRLLRVRRIVIFSARTTRPTIAQIIQPVGWVVKDVPRDGNCMFSAVVRQLSGEHSHYTADTLRQAVVKYLRENPYRDAECRTPVAKIFAETAGRCLWRRHGTDRCC